MGKKLEPENTTFRKNVSLYASQGVILTKMAKKSYGNNFSLLMREIVDKHLAGLKAARSLRAIKTELIDG